METFNYPVDCIILQPQEEVKEDNIDQAQESLCHVCGVITSIFVDKNIPHNLLMSDNGMSFYIIPRKWHPFEESKYASGFLDLSGIFHCFDEDDWKTTEFEDYSNWLKEHITLNPDEFSQIKKDIIEKLETEYEGTVQS
jgi:hypothetical protein